MMTAQPDKDARLGQEQVWIKQLVLQAQQRGYYGKLIITMEAGQIRRVVKEESLHPPF